MLMSTKGEREIELTEELLLKEHSDLFEREYMSKIENTDILFNFSEKHLLTTDNERAREIYLTYIADRLNLIGKNRFEVNKIDFYISNFCSKDSLLQDERFNTVKCKQKITKIQVILTYLFLKDDMESFFDKDSEDYLFSWQKNDILNYLVVFNDSMIPGFCFNYHNLIDFESYLYKNGIEENIVDFLIECYNEDKDTRPILILINALRWMDINIIQQNKSTIFVYSILTEKKDPNPIRRYFTNLMDRALPHKITKFPSSLFAIKDNIIENMLDKCILPSYFDYIVETNNFEEAVYLYNKLSRDYTILYMNTNFVSNICSFLIDLIEYASCGKNFNLNIMPTLIKNKESFEKIKDIRRINEKFGKIVNEADPEIITKKVYGYCNLLFRIEQRNINQALVTFYFAKNLLVAECSLKAISKCIKLLDSENSTTLLSDFFPVLDILNECSSCLAVYYYVECLNEAIAMSSDTSMSLMYKDIFEKLMKRVFEIRIPEEIQIFEALSKLFQSSNFPSLIYFSSKEFFVNIAKKLINTYKSPFIECASQLIKSILKMKFHDAEISEIYNEIIKSIFSLQPVTTDNMFLIAHLLSLLESKIIDSNKDLHGVIEQFLKLDQKALSTSIHYVKVIIQFYGFYSYKQIENYFLVEPDYETLLLIAQLPTDKIDIKNEEEIHNAISFADIIINYLESNIKNIKALKQVNVLANLSINYLMPIYEFLENETCMTFNNIIISLVIDFQINQEELNTFLTYFENPKNDKTFEFSWEIFRELKSIFVEKRCRYDIDDFDNIALRVLKFQHLMFVKDPDMAHLIFTEKVSKGSEYSSYAAFLRSQINKPFSEKPFKEFIFLLKKRYRVPIRSLNHI